MKKSISSKREDYLLDRIKLVLSAFGVGICMLIFFWLLFKVIPNEDWQFFVEESFLYFFTFFFITRKSITARKKLKKFTSILILVLFSCFPVFLGFIFHYFKLIPFPRVLGEKQFSILIVFIIGCVSAAAFFYLKFILFNKKSKGRAKEKMDDVA